GRFLPRARELVADFDRLRTDAQKEASGRSGRLKIGFGWYTLELVPSIVVKLRRLEPDIEISLRDLSTSEQIAQIPTSQLDVGSPRPPLPASARNLETLPVISGHLGLVVPQHGSLSSDFTLDDCQDQPFVVLSKERSPGLYDMMLKLCARHG